MNGLLCYHGLGLLDSSMSRTENLILITHHLIKVKSWNPWVLMRRRRWELLQLQEDVMEHCSMAACCQEDDHHGAPELSPWLYATPAPAPTVYTAPRPALERASRNKKRFPAKNEQTWQQHHSTTSLTRGNANYKCIIFFRHEKKWITSWWHSELWNGKRKKVWLTNFVFQFGANQQLLKGVTTVSCGFMNHQTLLRINNLFLPPPKSSQNLSWKTQDNRSLNIKLRNNNIFTSGFKQSLKPHVAWSFWSFCFAVQIDRIHLEFFQSSKLGSQSSWKV